MKETRSCGIRYSRSPKMMIAWSSSLEHLHLMEGWASLRTMGSTTKSSFLIYVCHLNNSCLLLYLNYVCCCTWTMLVELWLLDNSCYLNYVSWTIHVICTMTVMWACHAWSIFVLSYITEIVMHLCVRMLMQRGMRTIIMEIVMRISTKCFLRMMTMILWIVCTCLLFTMTNTVEGWEEATIANWTVMGREKARR